MDLSIPTIDHQAVAISRNTITAHVIRLGMNVEPQLFANNKERKERERERGGGIERDR